MKLSKQTIYIAPESTNKSRHITAPKPVRGMKPRTPGLVMHLFYKILFMTYFFSECTLPQDGIPRVRGH